MREPIIKLSGISKIFPGVKALNNVELELYKGEVTALIGENGAGKSTLVKTMTGIYQPDEGEIFISGKKVELASAHDAFSLGITAIHQETVLFDELSVAENIFLGHYPRKQFNLIDWKTLNYNANILLDEIGAGHINAEVKLKEISIANKHLVAVARALSVEADVVIMDEPTAALSYKEIEDLFLLIENLKAAGKAILFISHKFDEIYKIADRYTVFRDGEMVGKGLLTDKSQSEIVHMMVGRSVDQVFPKRTSKIGETILQVKGYNHSTEFADIDFELNKGEILGFYGLVGAGRSELMHSLFGITAPASGTLSIGNAKISPKSPADAIEAGLVYLPEERGKQGVVLDMPIVENISLPSLRSTSNNGFLDMANEFALARKYTERLDLRAAALSQHVGTLSGGNQQKVVIAKWLAREPKVIILDEPTKGIDIGSKAAVHSFMSELAGEGLSVIMVSSEIPEVMGMSDRIVVMREGRIVEIFKNDKSLSAEMLIRSAAGIEENAA
ncbi:MAG: sugar ABC transporter ATP-binding protein [Nitratireductor sp.]